MAEGEKQTTRRASSKKSTSKKSPSTKSTGTTSTSKKAPAKKSTGKKSTGTKSTSSSGRGAEAPRAEAPRRSSPGQLANRAAAQLGELTGRTVEGVVGLEKDDDTWRVQVEVLEVRRIPNTTDVLAHYEIDADAHGDLQGYRRVRRYVRGAADDGR